MWKWFNCYMSGRHEFGVWCERRAIFLRCVHCGKRSSGWALEGTPHTTAPRVPPAAASAAAKSSHVLPFDRVAAR